MRFTSLIISSCIAPEIVGAFFSSIVPGCCVRHYVVGRGRAADEKYYAHNKYIQYGYKMKLQLTKYAFLAGAVYFCFLAIAHYFRNKSTCIARILRYAFLCLPR